MVLGIYDRRVTLVHPYKDDKIRFNRKVVMQIFGDCVHTAFVLFFGSVGERIVVVVLFCLLVGFPQRLLSLVDEGSTYGKPHESHYHQDARANMPGIGYVLAPFHRGCENND